MRHIVWKAYWNHEKEEAWLNQLSAQGLALVSYSWCRYVFEDSLNGEYTYRIELLKNHPTSAQSDSYLRFLEQTGVECVATYWRWAFLRRKSADGKFDIFSDAESKINHYKRISRVWFAVMVLNLFAFLLNGSTVWMNLMDHVRPFGGNLASVVLNGFITFAFLWMIIDNLKKIKKLKREKAIYE